MQSVNRRLWFHLVGTLVGFISAVLIYHTQPFWWQAQVLIKVGQVNPSRPIEVMQSTIERIKSAKFIGDVANKLDREDIRKLLEPNGASIIAVRGLRNSEIIEVSVSNSDPEIAQAIVSAVFGELKSRHDDDLRKITLDYAVELERVNAEIDVVTNRLRALIDQSGQSGTVASGFLTLTTQALLEVKINRANILSSSLSSYTIRPTLLAEELSLVKRRYLSSLWRTCLAGALIGLVSASLLIWRIQARRATLTNRKKEAEDV